MIFVYLIGALLIITKLADVLTTLRFIRRGGISLERNRMVNKLMLKYGFQKTIWAIFAVVVLFVGIAIIEVYLNNTYWTKLVFIIIGIFVSIVQLSVAYYNLTGKFNCVVKIVSRFKIYR